MSQAKPDPNPIPSPELYTARAAFRGLARARDAVLSIARGLEARGMDSRDVHRIVRQLELMQTRFRVIADYLERDEPRQLELQELDQLEAEIPHDLERARARLDHQRERERRRRHHIDGGNADAR
jgi:hypothetical protein